ncbi:hypothetical protein LJC32_01295 [Oscillospiraceae bacterium OttesenSCG-928-F05]|nr:hypothetical protein [Oscillospiraceae bacterium OttesenSCG-928-F05]
MKRISLEERFQMAEQQDPNFLKIFAMYLYEFHTALSEIIGEEITATIKSHIYENLKDDDSYKLAVIVNALVGESERDEHDYLGYAIFVEPFAAINLKEQEAYYK